MSESTKIEWCNRVNDDGTVTEGATVSFWWGCTKIAPGCKFCYAEGIASRFGGDVWGPTKPRLYIASAAATIRRLEKKAAKEGRPRLVFVNSMSDFFEDHGGPVVDREEDEIRACACGWRGTPPIVLVASSPAKNILDCPLCGAATRLVTLADLRADAFRLFDECPNLRFLLLTKRPENVRTMWTPHRESVRDDDSRPNVWLGTSVSDQATADTMIPPLLACRDLSPVLFVSAEPLLGPVDLHKWLPGDVPDSFDAHDGWVIRSAEPNDYELVMWKEHIDWCIVGGESGPHARPMNLAWAKSLLDQCRAAGVKAFFKQAGAHVLGSWDERMEMIGSPPSCHPDSTVRWKLRDPKGGDLSELPEWCHVRECPEVHHAQA